MNNLLRKLAVLEKKHKDYYDLMEKAIAKEEQEEYIKDNEQTANKNILWYVVIIGVVLISPFIINLLLNSWILRETSNIPVNSSDICVKNCSSSDDFDSCSINCNKMLADKAYDCYDEYCENKCIIFYKDSDKKYLNCYDNCLKECANHIEDECYNYCTDKNKFSY